MVRPLLLVSLLLVCAGCLEAQQELPAAGRDEAPADGRGGTPRATYRFVEVAGNVTREGGGGAGICGFPSPPEINATERSIRFPDDAPDAATLGALVVSVVWERGRCGVALSDWLALDSDEAVARAEVPGFGEVVFTFRGGGEVLVDGQPVPKGGELRLSRSGEEPSGGRYETKVVFRDHGDWPRDRILS